MPSFTSPSAHSCETTRSACPGILLTPTRAMGLVVAWRSKDQLKTDFLSANGTQSGLSTLSHQTSESKTDAQTHTDPHKRFRWPSTSSRPVSGWPVPPPTLVAATGVARPGHDVKSVHPPSAYEHDEMMSRDRLGVLQVGT